MPHNEIVASAEPGVLKSKSWNEDGIYSRGKPSAAIIAKCAPYRFVRIDDVAAEAAEEAVIEPSTD